MLYSTFAKKQCSLFSQDKEGWYGNISGERASFGKVLMTIASGFAI
jgi:hypothetical protein